MKKKKNFKLIPFCISVLAVLLITGGIGYYSHSVYSITKRQFLEGYLSDDENVPTLDTINKVIELGSYAYQKDLEGVSFRDVKTKKAYASTPFTSVSDGNVNNYYKNGVMHIGGYFDVVLYAQTNYDKYSDSYTIQYNFLFFNIDYSKLPEDVEPSSFLKVHLVEGISDKAKEDYEEDETLLGDAALKDAFDEDNKSSYQALSTSQYREYFEYYNGLTYPYTLTDWAANFPENNSGHSDEHVTGYVYETILSQTSTSKALSKIDNATFAIYIDNNGDTKTLVEGTIDNIQTADKFNESQTAYKGYNNKFQSVPSYFKFAWKPIVGWTSAAFVISVFLAFLFYMIWVDVPETKSTTPNKKGKKKISK